MYYAFLDTETGGVDPKENTLLSVGVVVTDETLAVQKELEINIAPPDGVYRVTHQALLINQIDVKQHATLALPFEDARALFISTLEKMYAPLMIVGWNVCFDRQFLRDNWGNQLVHTLFGYRIVDLHGVVRFLAQAGKMPYTKSLEATATHFGLAKQTHTALEDARLSLEVYKHLFHVV